MRPGRSWSLTLGRIAGVNIRVHVSFLLLVVLLLPIGPGASAATAAAEAAWIFLVFACVVVHELAHCVVAQRRGIVVKDVLLLPIGGVSELESVPDDPRLELAISAAGPLTSLGIGVVAAGAGLAIGTAVWPPALLGGSLLARVAWMNVLLGGFNLLPALPLDGGRILRAGLSLGLGRSRATRISASVGRIGGVVLALVGLWYDIWLVLIGAFVYLGATSEARSEQIASRLRGITVASVMHHSPWVVPGDHWVTPAAVAEACRRQGALAVIDEHGYLGVIGIGATTGSGGSAGDLADREAPVLTPAQSLESAYELMMRRGLTALAVVVGPRVVGMLSLADLFNVLNPAASVPSELERFLGPAVTESRVSPVRHRAGA